MQCAELAKWPTLRILDNWCWCWKCFQCRGERLHWCTLRSDLEAIRVAIWLQDKWFPGLCQMYDYRIHTETPVLKWSCKCLREENGNGTVAFDRTRPSRFATPNETDLNKIPLKQVFTDRAWRWRSCKCIHWISRIIQTWLKRSTTFKCNSNIDCAWADLNDGFSDR